MGSVTGACDTCVRYWCSCGYITYRAKKNEHDPCKWCYNKGTTVTFPVHHRIWLTCPFNRKGGVLSARERRGQPTDAE